MSNDPRRDHIDFLRAERDDAWRKGLILADRCETWQDRRDRLVRAVAALRAERDELREELFDTELRESELIGERDEAYGAGLEAFRRRAQKAEAALAEVTAERDGLRIERDRGWERAESAEALAAERAEEIRLLEVELEVAHELLIDAERERDALAARIARATRLLDASGVLEVDYALRDRVVTALTDGAQGAELANSQASSQADTDGGDRD